MRPNHLPVIDGRYWTALVLASIAGANLGDFGSHDLGLGHWRGLPVLLLMFAAVAVAERASRLATEAFYWTAILLVRAAATNLGDLATHDLRLPYAAFIAGLAVVLALLAVATGGAKPDGRPRASLLYWLTMLTAGTLGTALGDACADQLGLGSSLMLWAAIWAVVVGLLLRRTRPLTAVAYWSAVAVVRTLGTNAGDSLAGRHGLALGLPAATALSTVVVIAVLLLWRHRPAAATA